MPCLLKTAQRLSIVVYSGSMRYAPTNDHYKPHLFLLLRKHTDTLRQAQGPYGASGVMVDKGATFSIFNFQLFNPIPSFILRKI